MYKNGLGRTNSQVVIWRDYSYRDVICSETSCSGSGLESVLFIALLASVKENKRAIPLTKYNAIITRRKNGHFAN